MFAMAVGLLSPRLGALGAKLAVYGGLVLLILLGLWLYGQSRFNAGVRETDAKWEEAGRVLQRAAVTSAGVADVAARRRAENFANQVAEERERIGEAEASNRSGFDILFGPAGL